MKKLLVSLALVGILLAGCGNAEIQQNAQAGKGGGFLVTVGYDKKEWYVCTQQPTYSSATTIYFDGLEYMTNDVVNVYPFRNDEELKAHMKKLGIKETN